MPKEFLRKLNENKKGLFLKWLNEFDGEPRIAWYPSAGEDFRDLMFLSPRFSDHNPATAEEPDHPDIFFAYGLFSMGTFDLPGLQDDL